MHKKEHEKDRRETHKNNERRVSTLQFTLWKQFERRTVLLQEDIRSFASFTLCGSFKRFKGRIPLVPT